MPPLISARRPSVLSTSSFGLDPDVHIPTDEPKPKKRGQTRVKMFSAKAARGFVFVYGQPQLAGFVHILTDPKNVVVAERPHRLSYYVTASSGQVRTKTHIPTVALTRSDGSVYVLDFETRERLHTPGWLRRIAELKTAYLEDHGVLYNAVDEVTLRVEPLHTNLTRIHAWDRQPPDKEAYLAVRTSISELGLPTTIGAVRSSVHLPLSDGEMACHGQYDRVLPTIGEMALTGEIALDHSIPLSDSTRIKFHNGDE